MVQFYALLSNFMVWGGLYVIYTSYQHLEFPAWLQVGLFWWGLVFSCLGYSLGIAVESHFAEEIFTALKRHNHISCTNPRDVAMALAKDRRNIVFTKSDPLTIIEDSEFGFAPLSMQPNFQGTSPLILLTITRKASWKNKEMLRTFQEHQRELVEQVALDDINSDVAWDFRPFPLQEVHLLNGTPPGYLGRNFNRRMLCAFLAMSWLFCSYRPLLIKWDCHVIGKLVQGEIKDNK